MKQLAVALILPALSACATGSRWDIDNVSANEDFRSSLIQSAPGMTCNIVGEGGNDSQSFVAFSCTGHFSCLSKGGVDFDQLQGGVQVCKEGDDTSLLNVLAVDPTVKQTMEAHRITSLSAFGKDPEGYNKYVVVELYRAKDEEVIFAFNPYLTGFLKEPPR